MKNTNSREHNSIAGTDGKDSTWRIIKCNMGDSLAVKFDRSGADKQKLGGPLEDII